MIDKDPVLERMIERAKSQHAEHSAAEEERLTVQRVNKLLDMAGDYHRLQAELETAKSELRLLESINKKAIRVLLDDDDDY